MGTDQWEWDGMETLIVFPHTSNVLTLLPHLKQTILRYNLCLNTSDINMV